MDLLTKISSRKANIGVVGLGYVGLPLAVEFAKVGFRVTGIDSDQQKTDMINSGKSYIHDVPNELTRSLVQNGKLCATVDYQILAEIDVVNICVPTPLSKTKDPDMSFIVKAAGEVASSLREGQLIILESTTYPGTTEEIILPILENTGLQVGRDFFLAFSPERIDPGNRKYSVRNIPKVVGGITPKCTELAVSLYENVVERVVPVSCTEVAEMSKLLENTFRSVNIGLANELALMCNRLGINVWEVIDAAATKPFGFMPFYPGPGLGGHCIPVDPFYLSWKAKQNGFEARFIELAGRVNRAMPLYVVSRITDALNERNKSVNGSKILVLGVAYKKCVSDTRESPALDIIELLEKKGAKLSYSDPYVPNLRLSGNVLTSQALDERTLRAADCCVIVTDHNNFDYQKITQFSNLIVDCRNALKDYDDEHIAVL